MSTAEEQIRAIRERDIREWIGGPHLSPNHLQAIEDRHHLLRLLDRYAEELQQRKRSFEDQLTGNILSAWGYTPEQIEESLEKRDA